MKAMVKDKTKNHNRRKAKGNNSFLSLTNIIFLKVVTTLRLSTRFYFEKGPSSCSICAEIQSDLPETRWVFSTESQAASQMRTRRAKLCVMASKQLPLPTLQPGYKCESKRNNKQTTNTSWPFTFIPLTISGEFLKKKQKKTANSHY